MLRDSKPRKRAGSRKNTVEVCISRFTVFLRSHRLKVASLHFFKTVDRQLFIPQKPRHIAQLFVSSTHYGHCGGVNFGTVLVHTLFA
jgi:hypothetical protein